MYGNESKKYIIRKEDFGALVYDINQNTLEKLTGSVAESRLSHPNNNDLIRGESNLSLNGTSLRAPEKLYLDLTTQCNMGCDHCLSGSGVDGIDFLSFHTLNNIGDQMVESGVFRAKLGGGEPTLHPKFEEIIDNFRKKLLGVSMSTNGLSITTRSDLATFLAKEKVKVSVSLDGGMEVHNKIRKHPLAYFSALRAIEKLKQEGANVTIGSTLSKNNLSEVGKIIEIAEKYEVPVKFKRVKPLGRAITNDLLITPRTPGYMTAINAINNSKWSCPEGILNMNSCSSDISNDIDPEHNSCGVGTRTMGINPKGQFSPCFFLGESFLMGDVTKESIIDVWKNGRTFLEIREATSPGVPECDICQRRSICHGECRAVALHMTGNINEVDPGCPLAV